jgi:hypothetical protein
MFCLRFNMNTKQCMKCKKYKELSEYNKNKSRKDGLQTCCRECSNIYSKVLYPKYKQRIMDRNKVNRQKYNDVIRDYKVSKGCSFCNENHPACLEFHHLDPSVKEYNIGDKMGELGLDTLFKEIDKCIVLCSNCHRKHHWNHLLK